MKTVVTTNLDLAADLIRQGAPVAFPTETVYGLGASVFDARAVQKIFAIKNRPSDNPLIAHISDLSQLDLLAEDLPASWLLLVDRFWPGPLTLVLKKSARVPAIVSAGHSTIAVRMPSHKIAKALIERVGEPLVAPSANLSGRPSPTCASDVLEDLEGRVSLILDGGSCEWGIESTVLSLVGDEPVLLRPGSISKEALEEVLKRCITFAKCGAPLHSPGMKYRHYAPKASIRFVGREIDLKSSFILSCLPTPGARALTEKTLYAELREADRLGVCEIDVIGMELASDALKDRLMKAAKKE